MGRDPSATCRSFAVVRGGGTRTMMTRCRLWTLLLRILRNPHMQHILRGRLRANSRWSAWRWQKLRWQRRQCPPGKTHPRPQPPCGILQAILTSRRPPAAASLQQRRAPAASRDPLLGALQAPAAAVVWVRWRGLSGPWRQMGRCSLQRASLCMSEGREGSCPLRLCPSHRPREPRRGRRWAGSSVRCKWGVQTGNPTPCNPNPKLKTHSPTP